MAEGAVELVDSAGDVSFQFLAAGRFHLLGNESENRKSPLLDGLRLSHNQNQHQQNADKECRSNPGGGNQFRGNLAVAVNDGERSHTNDDSQNQQDRFKQTFNEDDSR